MKSLRIIISFFIAITVTQYAQTGSINNTLGTGGSFNVKDGSNNFFRIDQLTGNSFFLKNIELGSIENSTPSIGVITKNGIIFLHNSIAPNTTGRNTFLGLYAGSLSLSGQYSWWGSFNTAVGWGSLSSLTDGYENAAFGYLTLNKNTSGARNSAFGNASLSENVSGYSNAAFGASSLGGNTAGIKNCAFGDHSLSFNINGSENSAFGTESLSSNRASFNSAFGSGSLSGNQQGTENSAFGYNSLSSSMGSYNSAFGSVSLFNNSTGNANSAFGIGSLQNNTTGNNNTAVGNISGNGITTGSNNTAIGYNAQVPNNAGDNQVRIGNTSITYAGIQVSWSITSDRRWKKDISPSNLGLDFITKLNPVSYVRKDDESRKTEYGLIAQEVEDILKEEGITNVGMLTVDNDGNYELRYNDLIAPIIKSIQELKHQNDELASTNKQLAEQNETLKKVIEEVKLSITEQIETVLTKFSYSNKYDVQISYKK